MGKSPRVCVIGAGSMAAAKHYPCLVSFEDVEIAGVCEQNADRLELVGDKFGIPPERRFYSPDPSAYRKTLEKLSPDGVYAIGPPQIMYDIWTWCLAEGYNLYIEKPMGLTMHQARALAYLAEKHDCITQVSHQRRSAPIMKKMRDECLKRGPIIHAVCDYYKCTPEAYLGARDHMMDDCVHVIDTVRWMCGGEIDTIESHCKRIGVPDINWIGAMLHFDNGSTGLMINSWCSGRRVFRAQMHAPGIYCDVELEGKAYLYADGDYEGVEYDTREVAGSEESYIFAGFRQKHREFVDSLIEGKELTSSPFSDCVKTMEIAETILANALLNRE